MQPLVLIAIVLTAVLGASGREIPSRIVGGSDAPDGKFPYMVSLRKAVHFCGGSIINKRWILTARHCIIEKTANVVKVIVGITQLSEKGKVYRANLLRTHPVMSNLDNDVGLIRVSEDIEFNEKIQPITLPVSDFIEVDYPSTVSGWGYLKFVGEAPNRLQYLNTTVISQESCAAVQPLLTLSHICTFTKRKEGTCHGDSGSPLTADGVQIGIVSFGSNCAQGYPDVYTRVWTFMGWIRETIEQDS